MNVGLAEIIGIGGPSGAAAAVIVYYLNYRIRRRTSESGVVETTKATLDIVRGQQQDMAETLKSLRTENEDLRQRLRLKDEQVDKLQDEGKDLAEHVAALERENADLRTRLERLEAR